MRRAGMSSCLCERCKRRQNRTRSSYVPSLEAGAVLYFGSERDSPALPPLLTAQLAGETVKMQFSSMTFTPLQQFLQNCTISSLYSSSKAEISKNDVLSQENYQIIDKIAQIAAFTQDLTAKGAADILKQLKHIRSRGFRPRLSVSLPSIHHRSRSWAEAHHIATRGLPPGPGRSYPRA